MRRILVSAFILLLLSATAFAESNKATVERYQDNISEGSSYLTVAFANSTISTDTSDYAPGDSVIISGGGFWADESVAIDIANVFNPGFGDNDDPWYVTADGAGQIETYWKIKLNAITPGFKINGSVIPIGCEKIKMTIMLPHEGNKKPVKLQLVGLATIGDKKIKRNVVPADNTMQAFLYRHLLPAKEFLAFVKWRKPPVKIITNLPVVLIVDVKTKIRVQAFEPEWLLKQFKLKLVDPPEGFSLNGIKVVKNGIDFDLLVDKEKFKGGASTNLLVDIIRHQPRKDKKGKKIKDRVYHVGYLPAISVVVK